MICVDVRNNAPPTEGGLGRAQEPLVEEYDGSNSSVPSWLKKAFHRSRPRLHSTCDCTHVDD